MIKTIKLKETEIIEYKCALEYIGWWCRLMCNRHNEKMIPIINNLDKLLTKLRVTKSR